MNRLTIVRGISGSGKTTFAKSLNIFHVEADMYFMINGVYEWNASELHKAHTWCYNTVQTALEQGMDVVVSNTFTTRKELKSYFDLGYPTVIYEMTTQFKSVHDVPEEVLDKQKQRWYGISRIDCIEFQNILRITSPELKIN